MRGVYVFWACAIGVAGLGFAAAAEPAPSARPNIVVILADDLGYSDLGCYGSEIETPVLDRLARNGLRFTQFYNTARCWPSRMALITGYYPQQTGTDPQQKTPLPPFARPMPLYLRELGYRNYHAGKVHLNNPVATVGADGKTEISNSLTAFGFDRFFEVHDHNRYFNPKNNTLNGAALPEPREPGYYSTVETAGRAIEFLEEHHRQHRDRPFFLHLTFIAPHFPLQALPQDVEKYRERYRVGWDVIREQRYARQREMGITTAPLSKRMTDFVNFYGWSEEKLRAAVGPYETTSNASWKDLPPEVRAFQADKMAIHAAMIDRIDQEVGRLVALLEKQGALDNTIILFLSDNGATSEQMVRGDGHDPNAPLGGKGTFLCLGPGWATTCNTPCRYSKAYVHEGGISSPLIVHWPAGIRDRGALRHTPGHLVDLLPTLVAAAGGTPGKDRRPDWPELPGRDLRPAFAADVPIARDYLFFSHQGNRAIRKGDWKAVCLNAKNSQWELYDLATDRVEEKNLAAQYPERVREMAQEYARLDELFKREQGLALGGGVAPAKAKKKAGGAAMGVVSGWDENGQFDAQGHRILKLGVSPALTASNNVRWRFETWIEPDCRDSATLMGNRALVNDAFFKIAATRGVQLWQQGKMLLRMGTAVPRGRWVRVEVVKTGPKFELFLDGAPQGAAEVDGALDVPALPVYLGGDPGYKPGTGEFARARFRAAAVTLE